MVIQCYTDYIIPPQAMQYNTIQCNATQRNAILFKAKQYIDDSLMGLVQSSALQTVHFLSLF